jgi:hypothetical protein
METINQKTARLTQLLMKERTTTPDIMQRVAAHCIKVQGKKLTEYLGNGSLESEKHAFLDGIITILEARTFELLEGSVPNGQTKSAPEPKARPAPVEKAEEEKTEESSEDGSDLPDPNEDEEEAPAEQPLLPVVKLDLTERLRLPVSTEQRATSGAASALAAALAGLIPQKNKGLTQEEIEQIVNERVAKKLAEVFGVIAQVLANES